jgi:hypothetical protein
MGTDSAHTSYGASALTNFLDSSGILTRRLMLGLDKVEGKWQAGEGGCCWKTSRTKNMGTTRCKGGGEIRLVQPNGTRLADQTRPGFVSFPQLDQKREESGGPSCFHHFPFLPT